MRRRHRHDRDKVRGKFLRRRPLIEAGIRTAPHRDFPIAKRLLRQPVDDVVAIVRLLGEGLEFATGIAASPDIDQREGVAM